MKAIYLNETRVFVKGVIAIDDLTPLTKIVSRHLGLPKNKLVMFSPFEISELFCFQKIGQQNPTREEIDALLGQK